LEAGEEKGKCTVRGEGGVVKGGERKGVVDGREVWWKAGERRGG
jgi:hypothetical protein